MRHAPRLLAGLFLLGPAALPAQRLWLDPAFPRSITFELSGGAFDDHLGRQPIGALTARLREPLGDSVALVIELPVGYARDADGASFAAIGNPYVGAEFRGSANVTWEFGARPGLAKPSNQDDLLPWIYGQALEFDRRSAWYPRVSTVHAAVQVDAADRPGMILALKVGLAGSLAAGTGGDLLAADYAGRVGIRGPEWSGWFGVIGHGLLNTGGTIGQRTVHQGELGVEHAGRDLQVGLQLRRYVGEGVGGAIPVLVRLQVDRRI